MLINARFSVRAEVTPQQYEWVMSPQTGVERVMLDRVGGETARATSIVRYAPGSRFPSHEHPAGEEILVLSGTFSEGNAHYPAGWYLRSPPGSSHQPFSDEGAVIFVKLRQMAETEQRSVRMDTRDPSRWVDNGEGGASCLLFASDAEQVAIVRFAAGAVVADPADGGAEVLVLEGSLREGSQGYERGSWLRLPPGRYPDLVADSAGATIYLKTGHLAEVILQNEPGRR